MLKIYKEKNQDYVMYQTTVNEKSFNAYTMIGETSIGTTIKGKPFLEIALNDFFVPKDYEHLPHKLKTAIKTAISLGAELLHIHKVAK